jgi:hypothetical protein
MEHRLHTLFKWLFIVEFFTTGDVPSIFLGEKGKEFHSSTLILYRYLKQIYFHDSRKMDENIGQIFKKKFVTNWTSRVVNLQAET